MKARFLPETLARRAATLAAAFCLASLGAPAAHAADAPAAAPAASAAVPAASKFQEKPATTELLRQLRSGGFTLYLRHGPTDNTKADRIPQVDLDDCNTQRPLTEQGRALMAKVGESMRRAQIPVDELRVSPLCRARDSAAAALPKVVAVTDAKLMYVANFTDAQKAPIIENTRNLLSQPVAAGSNRLLVAHAPNLMDLIGYFPKEGTLVVFRPKGNGSFEYLASIPPALWSSLLP